MAVLTFIIRRGSLLFPSGIHPEKHSHNHSVLILKNASEDFATRLTNLLLSFPQVRPSCFYFQREKKSFLSTSTQKRPLGSSQHFLCTHPPVFWRLRLWLLEQRCTLKRLLRAFNICTLPESHSVMSGAANVCKNGNKKSSPRFFP